jgi:hypothetical protein
MLLCYCICICLAVFYGVVCKWENIQRDKLRDSSVNEAIDEHAADFLDLTDKQNRSFRYLT